MSDAFMKNFLVVLLSAVGLATADYNEFCTAAGEYNVPHPTLCTSFINCNNNIGTVLVCPDDKWFDDKFLACLPKAAANCQHIPTNDVPKYVLDLCSNMTIGESVPSQDCDRYFICYGETAFELACPNGQHYSRAYSACTNPIIAGCRAVNTMCVGEYPGFGFPSLQCENFYNCSDSLLPQWQSCPAGQYFSPDLQSCTTPAESGCVNVAEADAPLPPQDDSDEPNCTASNTGSFFPHPECNRFYMCYNGVALAFDCECGLYYDTMLSFCVEDVNKICLK